MTWCFGGAAMADYEAQVRVAKALRELDDIFVENDIFHRVSQEFGLKLATLLLDIEEGRARRGKASGLVVLGPSGSGKTTAVERCIFSHPMLRPPSTQRRGVERVRQMDVCALKTPSPATLKSLGHEILVKLGYVDKSDALSLRGKPAHEIWHQVRNLLQKCRVKVLFIDEMQDLASTGARGATQEVINTLKSLLQDPDWPVCVVLAGTPELRHLVDQDLQLKNRVTTLSCRPLTTEVDKGTVVAILSRYAEEVGLEVHPDLRKISFIRRLLHASAGHFGKTVQEISGAQSEALQRGVDEVKIEHFAAAFRNKYDRLDAANPYLAEDFRQIRKLGESAETDETE